MTTYATMEAGLRGNGSVAIKTNNNLTESSAVVLKHALFALTAIEIFQNKKTDIYATDVRIKDEGTGREFSFTLTGKEI